MTKILEKCLVLILVALGTLSSSCRELLATSSDKNDNTSRSAPSSDSEVNTIKVWGQDPPCTL